MGVDIQTFRMRIGLFNGRRLRIFLRCGSFKNKNVLSALAIAIIIGQALMVGCVELNPGPDDEVGAVGSFGETEVSGNNDVSNLLRSSSSSSTISASTLLSKKEHLGQQQPDDPSDQPALTCISIGKCDQLQSFKTLGDMEQPVETVEDSQQQSNIIGDNELPPGNAQLGIKEIQTSSNIALRNDFGTLCSKSNVNNLHSATIGNDNNNNVAKFENNSLVDPVTDFDWKDVLPELCELGDLLVKPYSPVQSAVCNLDPNESETSSNFNHTPSATTANSENELSVLPETEVGLDTSSKEFTGLLDDFGLSDIDLSESFAELFGNDSLIVDLPSLVDAVALSDGALPVCEIAALSNSVVQLPSVNVGTTGMQCQPTSNGASEKIIVVQLSTNAGKCVPRQTKENSSSVVKKRRAPNNVENKDQVLSKTLTVEADSLCAGDLRKYIPLMARKLLTCHGQKEDKKFWEQFNKFMEEKYPIDENRSRPKHFVEPNNNLRPHIKEMKLVFEYLQATLRDILGHPLIGCDDPTTSLEFSSGNAESPATKTEGTVIENVASTSPALNLPDIETLLASNVILPHNSYDPVTVQESPHTASRSILVSSRMRQVSSPYDKKMRGRTKSNTVDTGKIVKTSGHSNDLITTVAPKVSPPSLPFISRATPQSQVSVPASIFSAYAELPNALESNVSNKHLNDNSLTLIKSHQSTNDHGMNDYQQQQLTQMLHYHQKQQQIGLLFDERSLQQQVPPIMQFQHDPLQQAQELQPQPQVQEPQYQPQPQIQRQQCPPLSQVQKQPYLPQVQEPEYQSQPQVQGQQYQPQVQGQQCLALLQVQEPQYLPQLQVQEPQYQPQLQVQGQQYQPQPQVQGQQYLPLPQAQEPQQDQEQQLPRTQLEMQQQIKIEQLQLEIEQLKRSSLLQPSQRSQFFPATLQQPLLEFIQPRQASRSQFEQLTSIAQQQPQVAQQHQNQHLENGAEDRFAAARERAKLDGLVPRNVGGDGACLFRAISFCLYRTEQRHPELRMAAVNYLDSNAAQLEEFLVIGQSMSLYLSNLAQPTWQGDERELWALANHLKIPIRVYYANCTPLMYNFSESLDPHIAECINLIYVHSFTPNGGHYMALVESENHMPPAPAAPPPRMGVPATRMQRSGTPPAPPPCTIASTVPVLHLDEEGSSSDAITDELHKCLSLEDLSLFTAENLPNVINRNRADSTGSSSSTDEPPSKKMLRER